MDIQGGVVAQSEAFLNEREHGLKRWHLAGYAIIATLALIPAVGLTMIGLPVQNRGYAFVPLAFLMLAALLLLRPLQLVAQRHEAPTGQLIIDIRRGWPWLVTVAFMAVVLPLTLDEATTIKKHIADFNPFYADPHLIRIDAVFGIDPWRVTHAVFGERETRLLDLSYGVWHLENIGLGMWLILARDRHFQIRAALSFQLAWLLLGSAMAVALASVGPCFVDDFFGSDYYAPLMVRLPSDLPSVRAMDYLLATQGQDAIGGGISAMPSLHVAITVLAALCIRERFPRWQWLAWTYAAVIYIGSIHLGWHYASDGIVSAAGVVAIWAATGRFVEWLARTERLAGWPHPSPNPLTPLTAPIE